MPKPTHTDVDDTADDAVDAAATPPDGAPTPTLSDVARALAERPTRGIFSRPAHWDVLYGVLHGLKQVEIAALTGYTPVRVTQIVNHPRFQRKLKIIREQQLTDALEGKMGPIARARAESDNMMDVLVTLAKKSRVDSVRRLSAMDVLAIAGVQAARKVETFDVNKAIETMTPEELDAYITKDEWPARLRERAVAAQLIKRETHAPIDVTPPTPKAPVVPVEPLVSDARLSELVRRPVTAVSDVVDDELEE